jgi:hypothetical protein
MMCSITWDRAGAARVRVAATMPGTVMSGKSGVARRLAITEYTLT